MHNKKIILALFCIFCTQSLWALSCYTKALSIIDGDTIKGYCNNQKVTIRLAAIDTPEKKQPFGQAAKQYLASLIAQKQLRVDIVDKDYYGRLVGNLFSGQNYINAQLVKAGYAWVYITYQKSAAKGWIEKMIAFQQKAKASRLGLWADQKAQAPWEYRKKRRHRSFFLRL